MLFRILSKDKASFKSTIAKVFFYFFIWFFFTYIIYSLLFGLMSKYNYVDIYKYFNFDITINYAYTETYKELEEKYDFIDSSLKTFYTGQMLQIDSDNYDSLFRIFPKKHFISLDENILKQKDSALILYDMAKRSNVDVGDYFEIAGVKYRVAGLIDNGIANILGSATIVLWDGKYQKGAESSGIESGKLDCYACYSRVFIILNDYDKGIEFFEKTHFNHDSFIVDFYMSDYHSDYFTRYGGDWAKQAIKDLEDGTLSQEEFNFPNYKKNSMKKKKTMHASAKIDYDASFNIEDDVFYSGLCVAALFSVCILESYQHAKKNQTKVAIMRILGYKRLRIFLFYFLRSFFIQIILMVCGIGFTRIMTSKSRYVSSILITKWFFIFSAVIAAAALLSSLVSMKRLRDDKLLQKLNEER